MWYRKQKKSCLGNGRVKGARVGGWTGFEVLMGIAMERHRPADQRMRK